MILYSVAIGSSYEKEAERLKRCLPDVYVFTQSDEKYKRFSEDDLINGLYHKTNFANYIDSDKDEPVIFCDADLFGFEDNPLSAFKVKKGADIAFVPYRGKWHFPDKERQEAFNHFGYKINSGFIYFRTLRIAKDVCSKWSTAYSERVKIYGRAKNITKHEYDEYALMIALKGLDYKIELLDKKWNDWELNSKEEIESSDSVFFQSHNFLDIV